MTVYSIAAVAENKAIGKNNDLIWKLPDDMKFFKDSTLNQVIITGRKNYESIPHNFRPLPNRINIILTRDRNYQAEGAVICHSLSDAIDYCEKHNHESVYVIGGGQVYREALKEGLVDVMLITQVHAEFEADTFYPEFEKSEWTKEIISEHGIDERHDYPFTIEKWTKN